LGPPKPYPETMGGALRLRVTVADTKGLSEKVIKSPSSSIHVLYNQALAGGLSMTLNPDTRSDNVRLHGGSVVEEFPAASWEL
jgi:hypothetical protein